VQTGISYEDFLDQYAGQYAEWVAGEVFLMAPETGRHDQLIWLFRTLLEIYLENEGGFTVRDAPFQAKLGPDLPGREPAVMVISLEKADRLHHTFLEGPPDIAIEVISAESELRDREVKFAEYEVAGVREYWLIDPLRHPNRAEFFRRNTAGKFQPVELAEGVFQSAVLPDLRFAVGWLLGEPAPTVRQLLAALEG